MIKKAFGLLNLHDPKYDEFDRLVIDEKSLPPVLPAVLDYSESGFFPAIDDQGGLGSCTAFGARKLFEFYHAKREGDRALCSARAIYSYAKATYEPGDLQDDGLNVSDVLNTIKTFYVHESDWDSFPDESEADFASYLEPVPENIRKTDFLIKSFATVDPAVENVKKALYKKGIILLGINFANSWMNTGSDGVLPIPDSIDGGHCMVIVGYNDTIQCPDGTKGALKIANNWTAEWGMRGYCYLPYSYSTFENGTYWPTDLFTVLA
jgi:C1A family cysteine protease